MGTHSNGSRFGIVISNAVLNNQELNNIDKMNYLKGLVTLQRQGYQWRHKTMKKPLKYWKNVSEQTQF